jgi:dihydroxy-acid dehydratase
MISYDLVTCRLDVELSEAEIAQRLADNPPQRQPVASTWLRRYAAMVTSANTGAVLADPFADEVPVSLSGAVPTT